MSFDLDIRYSDFPDFQYLQDALDQPEPALRAYASYRRSQFNQMIALGQTPDGGSVAPLSQMYAIAKKKAGFGGKPIRVRTGATKASYKCEVVGNTVRESVSGEVAGYLQYGTSRMPARPLLPEGSLPAKDQQKLIEIFVKYVKQAASRR